MSDIQRKDQNKVDMDLHSDATTDNTGDDDDDDDDQNDDPTAAMQQMMGFSNFASLPKPPRRAKGHRKASSFVTGANSQPVQPRVTASSLKQPGAILSASSQHFVPASLPPQARKESIDNGLYSHEFAAKPQSGSGGVDHLVVPRQPEPMQTMPDSDHMLTNPGFGSSRNPSAQTHLDEVAYTNPSTGYTFTRQELLAYERGVVEQVLNNDGTIGQVKVYFKPNFIEDNPWEVLEIKAGLSRSRPGPRTTSQT